MQTTKRKLGWILVALGALFLIGGLFVLIFITVTISPEATPLPLSIWEEIARQVMAFTIQLLAVDWTPIRVGVFLIVIGLILVSGGSYVLISKN
jgi:hypothetical protein